MFDSLQAIFPELSNGAVAKNAFTCANSGFDMVSFYTRKAEIMHLGFAVQSSWTDASALPKMVLTQLITPSTFPLESHFELSRFIQFAFPVEEVLCAEEKWTF